MFYLRSVCPHVISVLFKVILNIYLNPSTSKTRENLYKFTFQVSNKIMNNLKGLVEDYD